MKIIILVIVVVLCVRYIRNNTPEKKVARDPAISDVMQFLVSARELLKASKNLRLSVTINPYDKNKLRCQYQDLYKEDINNMKYDELDNIGIIGTNMIYNERQLKLLVESSRFPPNTVVSVLERWAGFQPVGCVIGCDVKMLYPKYVDKYFREIVLRCQQAKIAFVADECKSDYLSIIPQKSMYSS